MPIILICLTLVYAGLSAFVWVYHQKRNREEYPLKVEMSILAAAMLVHGAVLLLPVLQDKVVVMGFGYSVSVIVWLMLMMYWTGSFFYCLRGLQLLLYPCVTLALLLGAVFPGKFAGYQIHDWPFMLHIGSSLLSYSLFGIVTLIAVLILLLNHELHKRKFSPFVSFLPPLLSLEKLMFQGMWLGFLLLTYSVISGTFFAESIFGRPLTFTHKTVFGILSWFIYGSLLLKRSMISWRGKKAAVWTIIAFVVLMLAYSGSKFILEILV
ncbi:cytochrome C assembly family protein [Neisseria weaveri]|uniref:CcsA-like protein n=1 Tax=Neisseria weaveri TaxID=28091 RepID=A0A3S4YRR8_9NEIS|nr:cytochrome c biogenesis protein CcsA [Neisseria weaveri]EGV36636.1 cytochrome c assembly family protein [Neisseria weaveri ATCC 51223]EGV36662.1 cytochrome c assembly family protein [Neisseria weaveri LMG 5135]SAY51812.1 CcsA-like protein [Neisseria weaveri]VEJ51233.1 CcsA-like protein [Neisseria weaveri]